MLGLALAVGPVQAAPFVVDSTGDEVDDSAGDGLCSIGPPTDACTLRAAIEEANALGGADVISFDIGGGGPQTISPGSALPTITETLTVDGTTQPGWVATPIIELNGASAGVVNGLTLTGAGSSNSTIRGLVINQFQSAGAGYAVRILNSSNNLIAGNFLGTDPTGLQSRPNQAGVLIQSSLANPASNNRIGGTFVADQNIISANVVDGIQIVGIGATGNVVQGNFIGLDASGTAPLGNAAVGLAIFGGASDNVVGGTAAGAGNVISGNGNLGVGIAQAGTSGNMVVGNRIGTNAAGTASVPNLHGVALQSVASGNTIGGAAAGAGNVISGNGANGILIDNSSSNTIQSNRIGTDVSGTVGVGNAQHGILLVSGATNNLIGAPGAANVISGNGGAGILIRNGTTSTAVVGNIIGRDPSDSFSIPNVGDGIRIDGSSGNTVGGTAVNAGNVIASNSGDGVALVGVAAGNAILGNSIFANAGLGIDLGDDGVTANDDGDADTGQNSLQNFPVLSAAATNGAFVHIAGSLNTAPSTTYRVEFFANGAIVGPDPTGFGEGGRYLGFANVATDATGNAVIGVTLPTPVTPVTPGEFVTATATDAANNTSELAGNVVAVGDIVVTTTSDVVDGDTTSVVGLIANNGFDGRVSLREAILATNNTAGTDTIRFGIPLTDANHLYYKNDTTPGSLTTVQVATLADSASPSSAAIPDFDPDYPAGFTRSWYRIQPAAALDAITEGVVLDATTQPGAIPGGPVIVLDGSAAGAGVNGLELSAGPGTVQGLVVNHFGNDGLNLRGSGGFTVTGSYVGTDASGTKAAGNLSGSGVFLTNLTGASSTIGGSTLATRNVISANGRYGIFIQSFFAPAISVAVSIQGNYIGTDVTGAVGLGVQTRGIVLEYTGGHTIGGSTPGQGNLISGNAGPAIELNGDVQGAGVPADNNTIGGNLIGTDAAGTAAIPNAGPGVQMYGTQPGSSASGNTIRGNVLTAATGTDPHGIRAWGNTDDNVIEDNFIGTDAGGTIDLGNAGSGIHVEGLAGLLPTGNTIRNNTIRFNDLDGVRILGAGASVTITQSQISSNSRLGIDLNGDGVTSNDGLDLDGGPNDLLNFPVITSAAAVAGTLTVGFSLDVPPGSYRVEFFKNPSGADPSGNGEGEVFVSSVVVTHPGGGPAPYSHNLTGTVGDVIAATTTWCVDGAGCAVPGATSEFGSAFTVLPQADLAITKTESADPIDIGNVLAYTLTATNNGPSDATGVMVVDTLVPDVEYQSAFATQGTCNYDGPSRTLTCNLGVVASGGDTTVTLTVRPLTLGTVPNSASVGGAETDPVPGNNTAIEQTTVIGSQSCVVMTDIDGGNDIPIGVGVQADGRIVVGGSGFRTSSGDQDFTAVRYTPDLQIDGSFGVGGIASTHIDLDDIANAMALLSDGRFLLAGYDRVGSAVVDEDVTTVRYDPDGTLDPTFNPGGAYGNLPNLTGIVTTPMGSLWDVGETLVVQPDGKTVVGSTVRVGGAAGNWDLGVARYLPDGSLDPAFGSGGTAILSLGPRDDEVKGIALQPDGKVVLAAVTNNGSDFDWALARFDPDGGLDTSFGTGGIVSLDLRGSNDWMAAVAVQPDGRIVAIGQSDNPDLDFAVARFDSSGNLDTTFNPTGTFGDAPNVPGMVFVGIGPSLEVANDGLLQPDGKILAAGGSFNGVNPDFAMIRLNPDGSLDTSFGIGGKVVTAIGGDDDEAQAVALQPDGRILLAGRTYNLATTSLDFAVARYTPTGQLEGGCGTTRYRSIGTAPDLVNQGTITVTAGLSEVTKAGGLGWLAENRGQGDVLVVGPDKYTILDVVSDDELTLASAPTTGYSGGNYTIARQFKTLEDWEDCISGAVPCPHFPVGSGNLITDNRSEVGVAYKDSVFALTTIFRMDGSTTDALHTITLTANRRNRHNGIPGAGVVIDAQDGPSGIDVEDDYVTLEWLEVIRFRGVDNEGAITLSGGDGPRGVLLQDLLIHDFFDPTYEVQAIRLSGVGVKDVTVRNTMIWDGDEQGIRADDPLDVLTIENTSIDGIVDAGGRGIYAEQSTVTVTNTIVTGSASADFDAGSGVMVGSNNTSSDPTATLYFANAQPGVAAGTVFAGPGNLHLKSGPNPAVDTGVDLSSSSGFRGDIEGQLRPVDVAWDRGADELSPGAVDLALTKDDGQGMAVPGTPISYTITVTNNGPDPVTNVTVTDLVPPAILGAFFSTANGSYDAGTSLWTFAAPLLAGQSATLTLNGTIDPAATGTLTNAATVISPPGLGDTVPANDMDSDVDTLEPQADLEILKIDDVDPIAIGNPLTYTLTVTNDGPSNATGVVVTDALVPEMDYESATPSQGSCSYDAPSRIVTCDLGAIASGSVATVALVVRPVALGTFSNTASVGGNEPDPVSGNDSATETTDVKTAAEAVRFFTVTSTFEQNVLEWLNPPGPDYVSTEILYRTDDFPTDPADPLATSIYDGGTAGVKDRLVHGAPDLTGKNNQTFYYAAFVHRSAPPAVSAGRFCSGRPFDDTGSVKWAFSTGAFSLTPPTVGGAGIVVPANDNALYAMQRGALPPGGEWPPNWEPVPLGGVVQSRSPVIPLTVNSANPVVYLGAQDGAVYSVNGTQGGAAAFPWGPTSIAGMVQAAPAGIFSTWGGGYDYLLVGTRDEGADNKLVALDPDVPGNVIDTFDNGGGLNAIGIITGMATVDYPSRQVFFTSYEHPTGSAMTLWALQLGSSPVFTPAWSTPRALGSIESSPVLMNGSLYVGTPLGAPTGGTIYAVDAASGNPALDRTFYHGDGQVKDFVFPDWRNDDLYFATDNFVWALHDDGATINNKFPLLPPPGGIELAPGVVPTSGVLFVPGSHYVYVGGSDGRLYEIDVLGASPFVNSVVLGDGQAAVGTPSLDRANNLIHVGTEAGIFYAVETPLLGGMCFVGAGACSGQPDGTACTCTVPPCGSTCMGGMCNDPSGGPC